ncbi:hypothetical protein MYX06_02235 [Patescibacteria group bacterium AH-259-L05]|nr:hypothetical protein [Patescibacteria group bacterium AH-259-L05]
MNKEIKYSLDKSGGLEPKRSMEKSGISLESRQKIPLEMYEISGQDRITSHSLARYIKDKEQDEMIKGMIQDPLEVKISDAPANERSSLIAKGLASDNIDVRKECARMIKDAPVSERSSLIAKGLESGNVDVQNAYAEVIWDVPINERPSLRKMVSKIIAKGLASDDIKVQKACADMIWGAPKNEQSSLIAKGLASDNVEVQKACAEIIWDMPEREKRSLIKLFMKKGLNNILIESPLYKEKDISEERFSRQEFEKSGSETTLVGGSLKEKTIIRHIKPRAFLAWQELYENYQLWKSNGFDYVPIEPIQSYKLNKEGFVDVYSGVLDLNLNKWSINFGWFEEKLASDREKILKVLDSQGISHGHTHDANFVLRFFRDEDGRADLRRKPRIYLIDFDFAASPQGKT